MGNSPNFLAPPLHLLLAFLCQNHPQAALHLATPQNFPVWDFTRVIPVTGIHMRNTHVFRLSSVLLFTLFVISLKALSRNRLISSGLYILQELQALVNIKNNVSLFSSVAKKLMTMFTHTQLYFPQQQLLDKLFLLSLSFTDQLPLMNAKIVYFIIHVLLL